MFSDLCQIVSVCQGFNLIDTDCYGRLSSAVDVCTSWFLVSTVHVESHCALTKGDGSDVQVAQFNLLKTKRNPLYIRHQFVPRCKHFPPRL
jgi:hypothetical protein